MRGKCCRKETPEMEGEGHGHGFHHPHQFCHCHHAPHIVGMLAGLSVISYIGMALWMTMRMMKALDTMAMAKALDEMEDRLSDTERANLEGRIRMNLFPA